MNTTTKRILVTGLLVLGLGAVSQQAQAQTSDQIVVSVTPGNPTYAVYITSPMVSGYAFGNVNLGASTISTVAIVVKSSGTISEYFALSVVSNGSWTPVVADSAAPTYDQFELQGHFAATQPADASFAAVNDLVTTVSPGTGSGLYSQGGQTVPGNAQNLWLKLKMPASTVDGAQRLMTLTINGQAT